MAPTDTKDLSKTEQPPRIVKFDIAGSAGLGRGVQLSLDLDPKQTVLVGRNGAGKSAIMEAIFQGLRHPVTGRNVGPSDFGLVAELSDLRRVHFSYHWEHASQAAPTDPEAPPPPSLWRESCWWEGKENEPSWTISDGVAVYAGDSTAPLNLAPGTSLVQLGVRVAKEDRWSGTALQVVTDLCADVRRVPAGIPRDELGRTEILFRLRVLNERRTWTPVGLRMGRIATTLRYLMRWHDSDKDQLEHFIDLGRNLGAFTSLEIQTFKGSDTGETDEVGNVLIDGVNGGLAADGTLRIAEILVQLISNHAGLLLVEEPETAVHPGMLVRLLNVIESYSHDHQVVFSTHSPLVVSHAKPNSLRLVERRENKTEVRALSTNESKQVQQYLEDQGNLGEFVFSGGLDDAK